MRFSHSKKVFFRSFHLPSSYLNLYSFWKLIFLYIDFPEYKKTQKNKERLRDYFKRFQAYLLPSIGWCRWSCGAICVVIFEFFSFCGSVIPLPSLGKSSAASSSLDSTEILANIIAHIVLLIFRPRPWPREYKATYVYYENLLLSIYLFSTVLKIFSWKNLIGDLFLIHEF